MVRFSSSLEDKQPQKRNNEVREDFDLDYSRLTQSEIRQKPAYTQEVPIMLKDSLRLLNMMITIISV